ncbi:MAG TPA: PIN domain-containing protein [Terracidiphilus sp.]|jgi:predicted nucleic acid-binding protein
MILADTSIWINYWHRVGAQPNLRTLLSKNKILTHECVIAELALGSFQDRLGTLAALDKLPKAMVASMKEIRRIIEARRLYTKGIGLTDVHLLASCLISPSVSLWTVDKRLGDVAESLGMRASL